MSGSYKQCTECGKRALVVATRCPGCGGEFPPRAEPHGNRALEVGRSLPVPVILGLATAAIMLLATLVGKVEHRQARGEEESSSVAATPRLGARGPAVPAHAAAPGEQRIARTWTRVRARRSTSGDVESVLLPGDTVVVDSLERGWYRVALDGEVLGYAHQSTLVRRASEVRR